MSATESISRREHVTASNSYVMGKQNHESKTLEKQNKQMRKFVCLGRDRDSVPEDDQISGILLTIDRHRGHIISNFTNY